MIFEWKNSKKDGKYCIRITENIEVKTNDINMHLLSWEDRRESEKWLIHEHFNNYELFKRNKISFISFNENFETIRKLEEEIK